MMITRMCYVRAILSLFHNTYHGISYLALVEARSWMHKATSETRTH